MFNQVPESSLPMPIQSVPGEVQSVPSKVWSDWSVKLNDVKLNDGTPDFFNSNTFRETARILRLAFNTTENKSLYDFKKEIIRNKHTCLGAGELEKSDTVFMDHMMRRSPIVPLLKLALEKEFLTNDQANHIVGLPKDFKRDGQYYSESGSTIAWRGLEGKISEETNEYISNYLAENISSDEFNQFKAWTLIHKDDEINFGAREIEEFDDLSKLETCFHKRLIPITRLLELLDKGKYLNDNQAHDLFSYINAKFN